MSDNIGMNYYTPENETWAVDLDGNYMTAIQNYLEADGIPSSWALGNWNLFWATWQQCYFFFFYESGRAFPKPIHILSSLLESEPN